MVPQQNQQTTAKPRGKPGRPRGSGPTPASWKPGQSGNPKGGEPSEALKLARTLMTYAGAAREELAQKITQQALQGCLQSQRLLVERFLPPVRAQTLPTTLPGLASGSIEERLQHVLAAAARGEISADEAATLTSTVKAATEAASIANLERELQAIRELRAQALALDAPQARQEALEATIVDEEGGSLVRAS